MSEHIESLDACMSAVEMCIIVHELWTIRQLFCANVNGFERNHRTETPQTHRLFSVLIEDVGSLLISHHESILQIFIKPPQWIQLCGGTFQ